MLVFTSFTFPTNKVEAKGAKEIDSAAELASIGASWQSLRGSYVLTDDIDLSGINWNPIGNFISEFKGTLDGNGYTISNLTLNRQYQDSGLISNNQGTIKNLKLENVNVVGGDYTGALVGRNEGHVQNVAVVGGSVTAKIKANLAYDIFVGGLVGNNLGTIENSYASVSVNATVTPRKVLFSTIRDVKDSLAGGLVGKNNGDIINSYATGVATAEHGWKSEISGGLVGVDDGNIENSYYDTETTAHNDTGKGEPKSTADMKKTSTFTNWNFENPWYIVDGYTYPLLRSAQSVDPTLTLTSGDAKVTYKVDKNIEIAGSATGLISSDYLFMQVVDSNNQAVAGYERVLLSDVIDYNDGSLSSQLAIGQNFPVGSYTVKLWAEAPSSTGTSEVQSFNLSVYNKATISYQLKSGEVDYNQGEWTNQPITVGNLQFTDDVESERDYAIMTDGSHPNHKDWKTFEGSIPALEATGNYVVYLRTKNEAGHQTKEVIDGLSIDVEKPNAPEIELSKDDWTNEDVTVTLLPDHDDFSHLEKVEYKIGDGEWKDYGMLYVSINLSGPEPITVTTEGETVVKARATDRAGNVSDEANKTAFIDKTKPTITLNGDASIIMEEGLAYTEQGASVTDNSAENLTVTTTGAVDTTTPGTYTVTYTATDKAGNVAEETRTVTVVDITDLELNNNPNLIDIDATHQVTVTPVYADGSAVPTFTHTATFSSGDEGIATVDAEGLVTFHDGGVVTITASYGGLNKAFTLRVDNGIVNKNVDYLEILPGKEYVVFGTKVKVKMPADLPAGTKVKVNEMDTDATDHEGLDAAGDVLTFTFEFPEGSTPPAGSYTLVLSYEEGANPEAVAIYYYNEETGKWEYKGGEVNEADRTITLEVPHFSSYGVFVEVQEVVDETVVEDKQDELPDTATNMFNWILFGGLLVVAGAGIVIFQRRKSA